MIFSICDCFSAIQPCIKRIVTYTGMLLYSDHHDEMGIHAVQILAILFLDFMSYFCKLLISVSICLLVPAGRQGALASIGSLAWLTKSQVQGIAGICARALPTSLQQRKTAESDPAMMKTTLSK